MTNKSDEPPPEGPECRRVYEDLRQQIGDIKISELRVLGGRFLKKSPTGLTDVKLPSNVVGGGVRGKFIWLELETGSSMWITLGMSGYWSTETDPHAHFQMLLEDGRSLYFVDQRRFGTIRFSQSRTELIDKLTGLGLDVLNDTRIRQDDFNRAINKYQNKTVTEVLMNQKVCAGIGNYIKCEVLYRARVSPHRLISSLTESERADLFRWAREISVASYIQGGASIRNYQRLTGEHGSFVFEFEVYAQKEDPLGNPVVREETLDGRTTHWVPAVQR